MLRSFPPFPSPNPASVHTSPLENVILVPSPPSSSASSTPSLSTSTPPTPSSPTDHERTLSRSRSRSAARRCVPSHTRIMKQRSGSVSSNTNTASHSPPTTPLSDSLSASIISPSESELGEVDTQEISVDDESDQTSQLSKKGSLRSHHYDDAIRIACNAWGEPTTRKKSVTWEKQISP